MKFASYLLGGVAALVIGAGSAAAATVVASNDLNVRSGPGVQYPVVAVIPQGDSATASNCNGAWCRVDFRGREGWASRSYLGGAGASMAVTTTYGAPDYSPGYGAGYGYGDGYGAGYGYGDPTVAYGYDNYDSGFGAPLLFGFGDGYGYGGGYGAWGAASMAAAWVAASTAAAWGAEVTVAEATGAAADAVDPRRL